MTTLTLRESVTEAPTKKGNRWRVIVARPGQGSSGFYSEDLFRRDAHKIIAPGGQAFIGHDDNRSVKDLIGVYPEGARWSEEDRAVVADLQVFSHWAEFVEEVGPHVGISLYARGEMDEDGNITAFYEDPYNGADLVARPGLVGSGLAEKLYESAKAHDSDTPTVIAAGEERKLEMEKDVEERFAALETLLNRLVTEKQAAVAEAAQAEVDAQAVEKALADYDAAVDAIEAAGLPADVAKDLRAEARKGTDVAPLIEFAKKVKESATEDAGRIEESAGRVFGTRKVESAADLGKVFG